MTIITLPDWLRPQTLVPPTLRRPTITSAGRYSGATDVIGGMSERWAMSIGLAPTRLADSARVEALMNRLTGGVDLLQCHHLGRPIPVGTLRGSPVLSVLAAQGATTLVVSGARRDGNLVVGPNFEIDTNADGVADAWTTYSNGTTGAITYQVGVPFAWGTSQVVQAATLGATDSDRAGAKQQDIDVTAYQGATLTASVLASRMFGTCKGRMLVVFFNASGTQLAGSLDTGAQAVAVYPASTRISAAGPVPATAVRADVFLWEQEGDGGQATMGFDVATLEPGGLTSPKNEAPQVLQGDMLGAGGQLFQVAADTYLNDLGVGSIPVVNKVRAALAVSTPVVWNRPTTNWRMVNDPAMLMQPGVAQGVQIDLVEA